MANKIYPFKIKPTDILIQNEGGGGMLMNDQFVSIVGNVIPDQQKLLDDQIDVNNVGVQTDVFSSGIFITNVESNPLPIEDLASKNFDSLDENITESEVVVAQQNEPDELQLPVIIVSPTPSPSVPKPSPSPTPTPIPLTPEEIEDGIYIANFLPATEEQEFDLFSLEELDVAPAPEILISSNDETSVASDKISVTENTNYNNININKNGTVAADFLPKNNKGQISPYYNFVAAAKSSLGTFTKFIPLTDGGNKGCGAGVSIIYIRATGHGMQYKKPPTPGKDLNLALGTGLVYNYISKDTTNWKKRDNWRNAQPGDIIITLSKLPVSGHTGFVIDTKTNGAYDIVSNSSKKGYLTSWNNITRWTQIANRKGVGATYAFQFIGKFTNPGKTL
jgi:hypothetical protein